MTTSGGWGDRLQGMVIKGRKTYLVGYRGFIGAHLQHLADEFIGSNDPIPDKLEKGAEVIWSAGWPGRTNIDEVELGDPMKAWEENVFNLAKWAGRVKVQNGRLLVMSSGCLFDGQRGNGLGWRETDTPNFTGGLYHITKLAGERLCQAILPFPNSPTILRFRLPFDGTLHPRNTLAKMAKLPRVWNKEQSYTYMPDLVRTVEAWHEGKMGTGIWNVVQPGYLNNYEAVHDYLNNKVTPIEGVLHEVENMVSPRSAACLSCDKLADMFEKMELDPLVPVKQAWEWAAYEYKRATPLLTSIA